VEIDKSASGVTENPAEETNPGYTRIDKLGEFGLIKKLTENFALKNPSSIKGVGDDAAVIEPEKDHVILFSTDMLAEGVHFDLTYTPLRHLGYKAVAVNVSDICAMNGTPAQITVSIGISNQYSVEALEELYRGIRYACQEYGVDLVGGDTTSSHSGMVINISILGKAKKENVTYRNTALIGDILCVSGDLGAAYSGLLVLNRGKEIFANDPEARPDLTGYDYVLKRQLMPNARIDIVEIFKTHNVIPTAMIDISDGLSSEVNHLCSPLTPEGGNITIGAIIDEERIPIHENTKKVAAEFKKEAVSYALSGGEDYELLFTVSPKDFEKLKLSDKITRIGEIVTPLQGVSFRDKTGKLHPLSAKGWDGLKGGK
jgi:thiamine-monophosphate kinase